MTIRARWQCTSCGRLVKGDDVSHLSRWDPRVTPSTDLDGSRSNARYHPSKEHPAIPCGPLAFKRGEKQ